MQTLTKMGNANQSHPYASQLAMLRQMYTHLYNMIPQLMPGDEVAMLRLRLCGNIQQQVNFINGQLGEVGDLTLAPHQGMMPAQDGTMVSVMGPLTTFMGEALGRREPVDVNQLTASITDVEQLIAARDNLYSRFLDMSEDELLQMQVTNPSGTMLLRMVAKQAGLEEYDTRMVNIEYLSDLRELILHLVEAEGTTAAVDANAGKQGEMPGTAVEGEEKQLNAINDGPPVLNPSIPPADTTVKAAATTDAIAQGAATEEEEATGKEKKGKKL